MARKSTTRKVLPPGKVRLKELIKDAILDACNESEQRTGFYTMLDRHLATPFET